ncbi:sporulation-control protein [Amycolatopsis tolypomycina]|uniref:Sporulation-control protein n=1 Tax=Amycolatopsis tolypomycina TaxID=208445 RepID=A0A1H4XRJ6_9PSEU|nr:sporulation protein [Amycolatopsis tolypomycina]SED08155.1 sporulation-control protein [Amycolatopsis tolypomycina]
MFNRMLSRFGIGGPSVDTVLDSPHAVPGGPVTGQVHVQGGTADAEIGQVVLSLVARDEAEHGGDAEISRLVVQQGLRVPAGQLVSIPFRLPLPWETPITGVGGAVLPGMSVGVRTDLLVEGAPDKGDLDPVLVGPLPSQDKVLDAFGALGFTFRTTGIAAGPLPGVAGELGFHQELEFFPPAQYAGRLSQVTVTFVANAAELHVLLDADKRGDTPGYLRLTHEQAQHTDWATPVGSWLAQAAERGPAYPAFGGAPGYGGQQGYDDQQGQQRRGPGMGGMLAAGAAGLAGGMVLGGVADEFFGDDEG